jgi:esterase/lipase superfamily enzyme
MMRSFSVIASLSIWIIAQAIFTLQVSAQDACGQDGWILLATAKLDAGAGTKVITVPEDKLTRVTAVRIVMTTGKIVLSRIVVGYGNGQQHFEERPITLAMGERTRPLDEREDAIVLERVALTYKPDAGAPQQTVQVCARVEPLTEAAKGVPAPAPEPSKPRKRGISGGGTGDSDRSVGSAPPPSPPPTPNSAGPSTNDKGYREIGVYFGTSRRKEADAVKKIDGKDRTIATFSGEEGTGLTLGRAVVTIPIEREKGTIPTPEIDFVISRFALRSEDVRKDFTIAAVDVIGSRQDFLDGIKKQAVNANTFKRQAFVFVHGYNVRFDEAIFRTAQIAHDIGFDGPAVTFSWPSRGGTFDYKHDVDTAKSSRQHLLDLLTLVASNKEIDTVNIIAHSMGNDPLLEVLSAQGDIRKAGGKTPDLKLNEVLLAAPDIGRQSFGQLIEKMKGLMKGMTLYASTNDRAMLASKKFAGGLVRAGDVPDPDGPVIAAGIETIDVSEASMSFMSTNHSVFADRQQLVEDIGQLFGQGLHPPPKRGPTFKAEGAGAKTYWRYLRK